MIGWCYGGPIPTSEPRKKVSASHTQDGWIRELDCGCFTNRVLRKGADATCSFCGADTKVKRARKV